ncbi:MAG: nucleotide exchange factor GrpE [Planctomycetes bacterium]|nr:nucleotide exchange factor GrpE [Planctomycetota bacterium]
MGKDKKEKKAKLTDEQKLIAALEVEKIELTEKLLRIGADYANYQKRMPRQIAESIEYERKSIIRSLLPGLDNMSHALAGAENADGPEAIDGIVKGVKLVFEHILDGLKAHGVEKIEAEGAQFDPSRHEAMQMRTEEDKPDNTVLEVFQDGYMINDQVLRPSKVIVNKWPVKEEPKQEAAEEAVEDTQKEKTDEGDE